ncbi:class I SAM-dependent methyltransferase [Frateuria hangzhouensis]|uniref:class I SAM-dependent methyltransferase n=1 Tax=Frateuria hangzhouensis TaxID=2995589 RepID=UPI002260D025|nr:class I SAM-dependent methyltransferase [Frateuria sp. STR12]MCX7514573.1 class I SAM-dependent methyltransferase [Frateuria sp. STR12]
MLIDQDNAAYVPGFQYYEDNVRLLRAGLQQMLRRTAHMQRLSLLSLGVGHRYTVKGLIEGLGERLERYVIVEGSADIIELLRREVALPQQVRLEQSYFEEFETDQRFDVVEMGFVLEHVNDPELVLRRFRRFLAPGGRMMVAVPNADSLHRLIGHAAGLLPDVHDLSPADLALGHRRYFDPQSLDALMASCGLEVVGRAGLMLKPLTSAQLASLELDPRIVESMDEIGFGLPEICNAIFVEARPCD